MGHNYGYPTYNPTIATLIPKPYRTLRETLKGTLNPYNIQRIPESWNMGLGGFVLGSLILYLKGMRIMMFQLSGFYCKPL